MTLKRDPTAGFDRIGMPSEPITDALVPGELVVHTEHGIGRYRATEEREVDGLVTQFVVLEYASDDRLFVPPTELHSLRRYAGGGNTRRLTRLGTGEWKARWRYSHPPRWAFRAAGMSEYSVAVDLSEEEYETMSAAQRTTPLPVGKRADDDRGRQWWWFNDEFYWEDEGLTSEAVRALAQERRRKRDAQIERALARESADRAEARLRSAIPDDVKIFVWRRDEGTCVSCGSNENLEFDHIIPHSMGGANTARNIQLLCEGCNREKGGGLV